MDILPPKFAFFIKLNPMYYIVDGYRNSFLYHKAFWVNYMQFYYFWGVASIILFAGGMIFLRLKKDFAEVL
ncbi:ABC transporter, permease [Candidatus Omnitrophus magneticus]|uniref:ABC transporter, permease n=1 Tax=Candidatus Omnitrophus magneticus TaxID=1609969 RepID=A0A0F0CQ56_9BACT|nr:ABC transporter, permease [Candidatus Omnitrophus magneticus]